MAMLQAESNSILLPLFWIYSRPANGQSQYSLADKNHRCNTNPLADSSFPHPVYQIVDSVRNLQGSPKLDYWFRSTWKPLKIHHGLPWVPIRGWTSWAGQKYSLLSLERCAQPLEVSAPSDNQTQTPTWKYDNTIGFHGNCILELSLCYTWTLFLISRIPHGSSLPGAHICSQRSFVMHVLLMLPTLISFIIWVIWHSLNCFLLLQYSV